jgi:hypothetical protein
MKTFFNKLDNMQHILQADCLLNGIVIGSIGTLLLLIIAHKITKNKNDE